MSESDVYRRQIRTSKINPRAVWAKSEYTCIWKTAGSLMVVWLLTSRFILSQIIIFILSELKINRCVSPLTWWTRQNDCGRFHRKREILTPEIADRWLSGGGRYSGGRTTGAPCWASGPHFLRRGLRGGAQHDGAVQNEKALTAYLKSSSYCLLPLHAGSQSHRQYSVTADFTLLDIDYSIEIFSHLKLCLATAIHNFK